MFRCFTRTWWRWSDTTPRKRVPGAGRKTTRHKNIRTEEEARRLCQEWNTTHEPGLLSRKMEYEEQ